MCHWSISWQSHAIGHSTWKNLPPFLTLWSPIWAQLFIAWLLHLVKIGHGKTSLFYQQSYRRPLWSLKWSSFHRFLVGKLNIASAGGNSTKPRIRSSCYKNAGLLLFSTWTMECKLFYVSKQMYNPTNYFKASVHNTIEFARSSACFLQLGWRTSLGGMKGSQGGVSIRATYCWKVSSAWFSSFTNSL